MNVKQMESYMNRIELRYGNAYVQIPNALIADLNQQLKEEKLQSYTHYAYAFTLLNSFLYKYTHYVDFEEGDYLNMSDMKKMLKYNPSNQKVNAISKREDGFLERYGFLESTTDIPVSVFWENSKTEDWRYRRVVRLSGASGEAKRSLYSNILRTPKFCAYIPDFMIDYRFKSGTLNDYRNTFKITYAEFRYFVFDENKSLRDLLMYSYLKSRRDKNGASDVSYDTIRRQTGLSRATASLIISKFEEESIIDIKKNPNSSKLVGVSNTYLIKKSFLSKINKKVEGLMPDKR